MQKREQQIKDLTNKGTPSCLFVSHNFVVESTLYFILKLAEVDFYPVWVLSRFRFLFDERASCTI